MTTHTATASSEDSEKALTWTLPEPTGSYSIGTVALRLVDKSRKDPWVTSKSYRELMVSIWYPSLLPVGFKTAPHMAPLAAKDFAANGAITFALDGGKVNWAATQTHAQVGAPVDLTALQRFPVVLYASGLQGTRTLGTATVEELVSRGYVVVTVDHTYEAFQVEFPGNRLAKTVITNNDFASDKRDALLKKATTIRVADLKFVLDKLTELKAGNNPDADGKQLPAGLGKILDLSRVGALGFSMGGAVAVQLGHDDSRVDASANLDGSYSGQVTETGTSKPLLHLGSNTHTRKKGADNYDPSWANIWKNSTGWKREVQFAGTAHLSFSDGEVFVPQVSSAVIPPYTKELVIGTMDPKLALTAQNAYIGAFFDLHLQGKKTSLFDKSPYSGVTIMN